MRHGTVSVVAGLCVLAACAASSGPGRGFDLHFVDNRPADVVAVTTAIEAATSPPESPIVVIVPPPPARGATAFALPDGHRLWQTATRIDARPVIAGDAVISHGDSQVLAIDAHTGADLWRIPDHGFGLIGADGDGRYVALTLGPGGLSRRQGIFLVVDAHTGASRVEQSVEQALGKPAMAAGFAFVPWNGQYLSIYDVARNRETARIRSREDVFGRAEHEGRGVFFGARAVYRLSRESASGHREGAAVLTPPRDDLPGNPPLVSDGYAPAYAGVNARERVAMFVRPDPAQPGVHPVDGAVYALFHRIVFALDAGSPGNVRWAYRHAADIAGAQPIRGGLLLVDERGTIVLVDAQHGNVVYHHDLGAPVAQAVIRVPIDFAPPHASEEPAQSAAATLAAAAASTDNRLLPARVFATRALAGIPGDEATRGLLDIAGRRAYPQELRAAAGEALSRHADGMDALIEALNHHYDFLHQTSGPPVGFVARAVANAHERRAIAGLIAQLQDPETPSSELPPLVSALKDFNDASAVPALLDFVRLYHSDEGPVPPLAGGDPVNDRTVPEQEALATALDLAVQAVHALGGPAEQRWLQALADDPNTIATVHSSLQRAMSPDAAPGASSTAPNEATPQAVAEPVDPNIPPTLLTPTMIADAFNDARPTMLHCLDGMSSRPTNVRVQFRYDQDGNIAMVSVNPPTLQACVAPLASQVHLPRSQARQIGTYYLLGGPL